MRAGMAATAAGVSMKALRYYEGLGLLTPSRLGNGYRDYNEDDVRAVAQIRDLMALGLSPTQAEPFLECLRAGHADGDDCPESLAVYQATLDRLDALISDLTLTRKQVATQLLTAARRSFHTDQDTQEPSMTRTPLPQPDPLPANLPAPKDDGAAAHLPGRALPPLAFTTTDGERMRLDTIATARWVLYVYPLTGEPGVDMPSGWDEIPGARGCSQEACSFRDNLAALQQVGVQRVLGLSTDRAEYQQDLVSRLHLPYPMISDPGLSLARALDLPTFTGAGMELYKRLTLIVTGDRVEHVFYPIFPPGSHAEEVLAWLQAHPATGS